MKMEWREGTKFIRPPGQQEPTLAKPERLWHLLTNSLRSCVSKPQGHLRVGRARTSSSLKSRAPQPPRWQPIQSSISCVLNRPANHLDTLHWRFQTSFPRAFERPPRSRVCRWLHCRGFAAARQSRLQLSRQEPKCRPTAHQ